jgi:hypothetical protein
MNADMELCAYYSMPFGTSFLCYLLWFALGFDGGSSGPINCNSGNTSMATAAAMGGHGSTAMALTTQLQCRP